MASPNTTAEQNLNGNFTHDVSATDTHEADDGLQALITGLWLALACHVEATIAAIRLDIRLAASSLMGLLVTGIVVAALFLGLWFMGMGLLFSCLVELRVSMLVALLLIVLIQLLLLFCCYRFSKRMLANLNFKATRAALPQKTEP